MTEASRSQESATGGHRTDPKSARSVTQPSRREWLSALDEILKAQLDAGESRSVVAGRQAVLHAIALEMRENGTRALASLDALQRRTLLSERSVRTHLQWARDTGVLVRTEKGSKHRKAAVYAASLPTEHAGALPLEDELYRQPPLAQLATTTPSTGNERAPAGAPPLPSGDPLPPPVDVEEDAVPASEDPRAFVDVDVVDALLEHAVEQLPARHWSRVNRRDDQLRAAVHDLARTGYRPGDLLEELSLTASTIGHPTAYLREALRRVVKNGSKPRRGPEPKPEWPRCGQCDVNRQVELPDGRQQRCPNCHPLRATA